MLLTETVNEMDWECHSEIEGLFHATYDGRYLKVNAATARIFGYATPQELVTAVQEAGRPLCVYINRRRRFMRLMRELGEVRNFVSKAFCNDGKTIWISINARSIFMPDGRLRYVEGSVEDVTGQNQPAKDRRLQSDIDHLTGLINRRELHGRLAEAIAFDKDSNDRIVVVFIDLDQFGFINDSMNLQSGEHLPRIAAERLKSCIGPGDVLGRYGPYAFVLLLSDATDASIMSLIPRIFNAVSESITVVGREFRLTCGIGLSIYPNNGTVAAILLKKAETAMHRAKEQGHNKYLFYTEELTKGIQNR